MALAQKDIEVQQPPSDAVSSLCFSPKSNFLVGGSWDVKDNVRCWEISSQGGFSKVSTTHESPVLCTSWSGDGQRVFFGGCDGKAKMWNLATNQTQQIAQHSSGIKSMSWIEEMNCLATGSWDKTVKFWDTRGPNPVHTIQLPERLYCLDIKYPLAVFCTAERHIVVYNLSNPSTPFKTLPSPLKFQSRAVSCFIDKSGFAIGSTEGRVGIEYIQDTNGKSFAFKCHRENSGSDIYPVNSISFHPQWGTFATAGGDGTFNFWDKDSKQRLKAFTKMPQPISATSWNFDGTLFAYSVCYDWFKGSEHYNPNNKSQIFFHPTPEAEIKNKPKK
eukprot:TRINITY_DN11755_c0_g1_i1.p1 TRINITY_DN11755_c0_g1~~TRINITY_DN11755_c0_g1_i1.p1  ORF type:complete len:331 (-),score=49.90 TRINITY_DN11755_c0_g1_i1:22-1014(-)